MPPFRLSPQASAHLDLVRCVAALIVMVGHLRSLFFVEYSQILHRNLPVQVLYALTAFGHESVMIFFVLSGLFIGPSVLESILGGKWSWKRYSANRLTRLYIVLVPVLLLTAALDHLGLFGPGAVLAYRMQLPNLGAYTVMGRETWTNFGGNLLFLQSILCDPFGSAGPLWSLSYEFWYYVLFPIIVFAFARNVTPAKRLMAAICALVLAWFIGRSMIEYFSIWLMGTLIAYLAARGSAATRGSAAGKAGSPRYAGPAMLATGALLAAVSFASRFRWMPDAPWDYIHALAGALFIATLLRTDGSTLTRIPGDAYTRFAHWSAGFSYTTYVAHLPIAIFLRAFLITADRWQPTALHLLAALGVFALDFAICYLISLATEAQTARVRRAIL